MYQAISRYDIQYVEVYTKHRSYYGYRDRAHAGHYKYNDTKKTSNAHAEICYRSESARATCSRTCAVYCEDCASGRSSKRLGAEPRVKSAAGIRLTPANDPIVDHLQVVNETVASPPSPKPPGQGEGRPSRHEEAAKTEFYAKSR